jgi:uncharacterized protein YbgA (DUF1722 family)/uncharacterized protein YbbK (DUF523 family)
VLPRDPGVERPLRLGVSACLLGDGDRVRWDGQHKRDAFLADRLAAFATWVPVCPEVELGLGVPRETIRLERSDGLVRLVAPGSGRDLTAEMQRWSARRVAALEREDLDGYVLKKDSPSCGLERVRVWRPGGRASPPARDGVGAFARVLLERMPLLPVEEEGRLQDDALRENFVERVFAYRRLKTLLHGRWTLGGLVAFHAREKLLLLAHAPAAYRRLGAIVGGAKGRPRGELGAEYGEGFMSALARLPTRGTHANALQHVAGFFKRSLSAEDRAELAESVADYRRGLVPLVVPITLLRHHVRRGGPEWLRGQTYLEPHPKELMLRNHA